MGSYQPEFTALQPLPAQTLDSSKTLPDLIRRINIERGGFRELTEESLRREIAEAEADGATQEERGSEDEGETPDHLKELTASREEMLGHLESAHQSAMFALDFVSLLLSKDLPTQAGSTLSDFLRINVGLGTLGADVLAVPKPTAQEKADNSNVAKGWKIQTLNKTVDSILASAARLETEIELETKYWEEVLAINSSGWSVCRLPTERQTLGVRFGFSESAPAFRNRSYAALRRESDGHILLDQGIASTEPQALRIRIQSNGSETGCSGVPAPIKDDGSIEARILQARNTIFALELWQELNRETRSLFSYGVRASADTLSFPLSLSQTVLVDLIPLSDYTPPASMPSDQIAEGISLALNLLMCFMHKQNHRRRTTAPIIGSQKRQAPPTLLRPLITRLTHQNVISSTHQLLEPLITLLRHTSLPATYTVTSIPHRPSILTPSEATIASLIDHLTSTTVLTLTPTTTITMTAKTAMFPVAGSIFSLSLSPESPLLTTCKPPPPVDTFAKVVDYLLYATSCAVASHVVSLSSPDPLTPSQTLEAPESWHPTIQDNVLRKRFVDGRTRQLVFSIADEEDAQKMRLLAVWDMLGGGGVEGDSNGKGKGEAVWNVEGGPGSLESVVAGI